MTPIEADRRGWLEHVLLLVSLAGLPITHLTVARLGRRGGLLVEAVCLLLFCRAAQLIGTGTPARLRTLPRALVYLELVIDGLAAATGLSVWVPRPGGARVARLRRLNEFAVACMFGIHSIRFAIYVSPGRGRRNVQRLPAAM